MITTATRTPVLLHQIVERQAELTPDAPALYWRGTPISYRTLQERVTAVSRRLALEGRAGDRVAVLAWNCPEFVELIYGVPAAGRVLVPLNARLAPAELVYQLRSTGVTTPTRPIVKKRKASMKNSARVMPRTPRVLP